MAFHEEMESEFDFSITRYLTHTHEMLGRNLSSLRSLRLETNYTVNSYLFKVSQQKKNLCLPVLLFTVKVGCSYNVYFYKLSVYLYVLTS